MNELLLLLLLFGVAFAYGMVGHGGASGYQAVLGIAGLSAVVIKPTALVLNLGVSAIAFVHYWRAGHFRWRMFWPFALLSIPCAFLGAGISLSDLLYKRLLAACVVIAALRMLGLFDRDSAQPRAIPIGLAIPIGAGLGLASGALGIGGGILLSPLLLMARWADAKSAAATSALFIFVNSAAGLVNVSSAGVLFTGEMMGWVLAAMIGGLIGAWLGARRAPEPRLRQALGVVLLLASVKLIWP